MDPNPSDATVANVRSKAIGVPPSIDRSPIVSSLGCDCTYARSIASELIESGSGALGRGGMEPEEEDGIMLALELIAFAIFAVSRKDQVRIQIIRDK
jgi:hypothetical protein